jgi:hypothetical protein
MQLRRIGRAMRRSALPDHDRNYAKRSQTNADPKNGAKEWMP